VSAELEVELVSEEDALKALGPAFSSWQHDFLEGVSLKESKLRLVLGWVGGDLRREEELDVGDPRGDERD
jgi:hypothetical protein